MMKNLKKVLSLVSCLALLMTFVPAAMAEGASVSTLTVEDITGHQPANMITENLTLPEGYTWTASVDGVINTETGAVTRKATEDVAVTLTAEAGGESKAFNFIVKSKMTKVLAADTFAYDYAEGVNPIAQSDFIFTAAKTTITHPILKEADGNSYYEMDWTYAGSDSDSRNSKENKLRNVPEEFKTADVIYVSYKYKYVGKSYGFLRIFPAGVDTLATSIGYNGTSFRYSSFEPYTGPAKVYNSYAGDGTDAWQTAYLKYNVDNMSFCISDDGRTYLAEKTVRGDFSDKEDVSFTNMSFKPASVGSNCGKLLIDDFVIYTESIDNLSDSDKDDYVDSELDFTDLTDEKASYISKNLTLPAFDGLVTWTSSDENVIKVEGETGVIGTRDDNLFKPVILTATYGSKTKKFNLALAPADTTTIIRANSECELLEDFEGGADGGTVSITQGTNYNTTKGWIAANPVLEGRTFEYAVDSTKGMVGKLTDSTGTAVSLVPGNAGGAQYRYTTGLDIKFTPENSTDSFTFAISASIEHSKIVITKNNLRVYEDAYVYPNQYSDYEVDTNDWIRIEIDTNMASRTQEIFVNGISLTGVLKNGTYTQQYKTSVTTNTLRWLKFTANGNTPVYIDNIAVAGQTNANRSLADAGVKGAQVFYKDSLLTAKALEANGPSFVTAVLVDKTTFANNGAALAWSGNSVSENKFTPTKPGEYTLTVTATSGIETATGTVSIKGAPVIIGEADGVFTLSGATEGGKLIVAEFSGEGEMIDAKVYDTFENISIPDGNYKAFFVTDISKLIPGAFAIE